MDPFHGAGSSRAAADGRDVLRRASALGAAVVLTAALGTATSYASEAQAPTCTDEQVAVVLDPASREGDVRVACADEVGVSAWKVFDTAYGLTGVQRQPEFICRVDGEPADDPCVNTPQADAYWGFFTGDDSGWTFATVGAPGVRVAAGESVALVWQDGGETDVPSVDATELHGAEPGTTATTEADDRADAEPDDDTAAAGEDEPSKVPTGLLVAGFAVVAVAVVATRLRRRGNDEA